MTISAKTAGKMSKADLEARVLELQEKLASDGLRPESRTLRRRVSGLEAELEGALRHATERIYERNVARAEQKADLAAHAAVVKAWRAAHSEALAALAVAGTAPRPAPEPQPHLRPMAKAGVNEDISG